MDDLFVETVIPEERGSRVALLASRVSPGLFSQAFGAPLNLLGYWVLAWRSAAVGAVLGHAATVLWVVPKPLAEFLVLFFQGFVLLSQIRVLLVEVLGIASEAAYLRMLAVDCPLHGVQSGV